MTDAEVIELIRAYVLLKERYEGLLKFLQNGYNHNTQDRKERYYDIDRTELL